MCEIIYCRSSKKLWFLANHWFALSAKCFVERKKSQVTKLPNYSLKLLEIANALFNHNIIFSFQVRQNNSCYIFLRLSSKG